MILGHTRSSIFQHYISSHIQVDVEAIVTGVDPRSDSLEMSLGQDPRCPKQLQLSPEETWIKFIAKWCVTRRWQKSEGYRRMAKCSLPGSGKKVKVNAEWPNALYWGEQFKEA